MKAEDKKLLEAHIKEIANIFYKKTPPEKIETFEGIKTSVRDQVLEDVSSKSAFFCRRKDCHNKGKKRTIRSCIGKIKVTNKQASRLGIEPGQKHINIVYEY